MPGQILLIEPHYLPCIRYFRLLRPYNNILIETAENFRKQTYRNRCYILGANKTECLTVPVLHPLKKPLRDMVIDYSENWHKKHLRAIETAYGKAPFFEYYIDYFAGVLHKKHRYLLDLNLDTLEQCCKLTGLSPEIKTTTTYITAHKSNVIDNRNVLSSKDSNQEADQTVVYQQVFDRPFVPNLSVLDLLFNTGPEAGHILANHLHR